jgi:hypothetical protein
MLQWSNTVLSQDQQVLAMRVASTCCAWLNLWLILLLLFCSDLQRFGKVAKLAAFKPFASAADALEQINAVSEAQLTEDLKNFLTMNLPKVSRACSCGGRHDAWQQQQQ